MALEGRKRSERATRSDDDTVVELQGVTNVRS
jgi:hypothetical protein